MRNICLALLISVVIAATGFGQKNPTSLESKSNKSASKNFSGTFRVKIVEKPRAAYPQSDSGTLCMQGSVRLKVEFLESGEIGRILPVTRMPYGATENAVEAAKKIKFIPAKIDGHPVTSILTVDYSFSIY